jgi:hypothetical protein
MAKLPNLLMMAAIGVWTLANGLPILDSDGGVLTGAPAINPASAPFANDPLKRLQKREDAYQYKTLICKRGKGYGDNIDKCAVKGSKSKRCVVEAGKKSVKTCAKKCYAKKKCLSFF